MSHPSSQASSHFKSALEEYLARLDRTYDPMVVQSVPEFLKQVEDLSFEYSLAVKTLMLPQGITLTDPRLREARVKSGRTYMLEPGQQFKMPDVCCFADIDQSLVPPAIGPRLHEETRYQILGESEISHAQEAAAATGKPSMYQPTLEEERQRRERHKRSSLVERLKDAFGLLRLSTGFHQ